MKITTRTRPSTRCWTMSFSMLPAVNVATTSGRMKNSPMPRTAVMPSISATPPLPISTPSSSAWRPALRTSQLGAHDEGLVEHDEPAHERPLGGGLAAEAALELLRGVDDPAVGMTEGDGDGIAAAHHDAFDERLAAIGEAGHWRSLPGAVRAAASAPLARSPRASLGVPTRSPRPSPPGTPRIGWRSKWGSQASDGTRGVPVGQGWGRLERPMFQLTRSGARWNAVRSRMGPGGTLERSDAYSGRCAWN